MIFVEFTNRQKGSYALVLFKRRERWRPSSANSTALAVVASDGRAMPSRWSNTPRSGDSANGPTMSAAGGPQGVVMIVLGVKFTSGCSAWIDGGATRMPENFKPGQSEAPPRIPPHLKP